MLVQSKASSMWCVAQCAPLLNLLRVFMLSGLEYQNTLRVYGVRLDVRLFSCTISFQDCFVCLMGSFQGF